MNSGCQVSAKFISLRRSPLPRAYADVRGRAMASLCPITRNAPATSAPFLSLTSTLQRSILEEYERLRSADRKHLVLQDLLKLRFSQVPVANLAVLWVLDRDHDGRVTLEDLYSLAELCLQRAKLYQNFEFEAQMRGYCTLLLWRAMCAPSGQHAFVQWVCALVLECGATKKFKRYGRNATYVSTDTVEALHHLLRLQETNGLDFQTFVDLLQRAGEEKQLMDLSDEELDDWVPLEVLQDFVASMFAGMANMLNDICPAAELNFADL